VIYRLRAHVEGYIVMAEVNPTAVIAECIVNAGEKMHRRAGVKLHH